VVPWLRCRSLLGGLRVIQKVNRSVDGSKSLSIGRFPESSLGQRDAIRIECPTDRLEPPAGAGFRQSAEPFAISHAFSVNRWLSKIRAFSLLP
jgi:hypothetical protein